MCIQNRNYHAVERALRIKPVSFRETDFINFRYAKKYKTTEYDKVSYCKSLHRGMT